MSERLPVVSGAKLIRALERRGWQTVRQRGSHVRMKHPDRSMFLVAPLHRELKRGTLNGILRDAVLGRDELRGFSSSGRGPGLRVAVHLGRKRVARDHEPGSTERGFAPFEPIVSIALEKPLC